MKIQINNLEALERLIGGDTELEIDIRNSVVQRFTEKHLKGVANELMARGISETIRKEISASFMNEEGNYYNKTIVVKPEFADKLKTQISIEFYRLMSGHIETEIIEFQKKFNDLIQSYGSQLAQRITDEQFEKRVNEAADKKIKERLGVK